MFKLAILLLGVVALSHQKDLSRRIVPYKDIPRGRIEGGTEAEPNSWPWQGWITSHLGDTVNCGAVLVDASWIMTAAHCLDGYASTRATFGDHDTTRDEGPEQLKSITSDQFVSPEAYSFPEYDIALINMERDPFELTAQVAVAELTKATPAAGTDATLTGWGRITKNGAISDVLKEAVLQIRESSVCNTYYNMGDQNDRFLICLEDDEGVDSSCNGDSGGALNVQEDGVWRVGGVTSYGSSARCAGAPVGYSSTNKHACWLEANNNGAFEANGDPTYNNC